MSDPRLPDPDGIQPPPGGVPAGPDDPTVPAGPPGHDSGSALPRHDFPKAGWHAGATVNAYKLVGRLGRGGFGEVWLAQQQEPIRREVALKRVRPGLESDELLARFRHENQALAIMSHRHIVRVFTVEEDAAGLPFCVMEYVRGETIDAYCAKHKLSNRERVALMIPLCKAVHYVHQRGIIHRDIKPSNILVVEPDGPVHAANPPGLPVLIDFGVAKSIGVPLTNEPFVSVIRAAIGTYEYMSPEQADGGPLGVDVRTDVYSLGAVLYELLTGSIPVPIPEDYIRRQLDLEIRRVIRELLPAKPSTRISARGADSEALAAQRRTGVQALTKELRGSLALIPLKALEKDRQFRYSTADELSRDLHSYLAGETLIAEHRSLMNWLEKKARRHRKLLPAAATVGVALLLGVIATSVATFFAMRNSGIARIEALNARAAQGVAVKEKALAEKATEEAQWQAYVAGIAAADSALRLGDGPAAARALEACPTTHRGWEWKYLSGLSDSSEAVRWSGQARMLEISPLPRPGGLVATTVLQVFRQDSPNSTPQAIFTSAPVSGSLLSKPNTFIRAIDATGRWAVLEQNPQSDSDLDKCSELWLVRTDGSGKPLLLGEPGRASETWIGTAATFSPDGAALAARVVTPGGQAVRIFDVDSGRRVCDLPALRSFGFDFSGRVLISGDPGLPRFDVATGGRLKDLVPEACSRPAERIFASPDGTLLATTDSQGLDLYRISGERADWVTGVRAGVTAVAFSRGDGFVAVAEGSVIEIIDAATGASLRKLYGHAAPITSLAVGPDGKLYSGSDLPAAELRSWRLEKPPGAILGLIRWRNTPCGQLATCVAGREFKVHAANESLDRSLQCFSTAAADAPPCDGHDDADASDDARVFATSGPCGVTFWSGELKNSLRSVEWPVGEPVVEQAADLPRAPIRFLPASHRAVVLRVRNGFNVLAALDAGGGAPTELRRWDFPKTDDEQFVSLSVCRTTELIAVSMGKRVEVLHRDGTAAAEPFESETTVHKVEWSPDGSVLAVGRWNGSLTLLSRDLKIVGEPGSAHNCLADLAWIGSSNRLVSCGSDGLLKVWSTSPIRLLLCIGPLGPGCRFGLGPSESLLVVKSDGSVLALGDGVRAGK